MVELRVIQGGKFFDPDEIPAPDKPIEEWTEEDNEQYQSYLWDNAEKGTMQYAIKNLSAPAGDIETAARVLAAIKKTLDESAAREGIRSEFDFESPKALLWMLRRRVKADGEARQTMKT